MAKQEKSKVVYYHSTSEKIFRNTMPKAAELMNSIKPHLQRLGFLENVQFTDLAMDLFKGNHSKIDEIIEDAIIAKSGNIEYVQLQIRRELNENKRQVIDFVQITKSKIDGLKSLTAPTSFDFHTLDYDECLSPIYLSVDAKNDEFIFDEASLERVKYKFEIVFEGEALKAYEELVEATRLLDSVTKRIENLGIDSYYFYPQELIDSEDGRKDFTVKVLDMWEMFQVNGIVPSQSELERSVI